MSDERSSKSDAWLAPLILTACHGILWILSLGIVLRIVPNFERIFADFGTELPAATIWAIGLSNFAFRYWYFAILLIASLCAVDLAVLRVLFARPKRTFLAWLWAMMMFLAPLALTAWLLVSLWIAFGRVLHSLS